MASAESVAHAGRHVTRALVDFYGNTFARVVAVIYTGGTVAHTLQLLLDFGWEYMPFWIDWALIVLGTYGGLGLLIFARRVAWRARWERVLHWLIAVHLLASVLVHAWTVGVGDHEFFTLFPNWYSYAALAYFALFAWRSWTMRLTAETNPGAAEQGTTGR